MMPSDSMRTIGLGERAIGLMLLRITDPRKQTFGKTLYQHGSVADELARSRIELDGARLLVYAAAHQIDAVRAKGAMKAIGMAKALVPVTVNKIIDRAMQVHGGEGVSQDQPLAAMFAAVRTLRFADVSVLAEKGNGQETHIVVSRVRTRYIMLKLRSKN